MLHIRRFGSGPPVVALHGFSLSGQQFSPAAQYLDRTIYAPDLPGHGLSRAYLTDVDSVTDAIEKVLDSIRGAVPVIGYSQGARMALLTAVEKVSHVSALALVSGSPGIEEPDTRRARIASDLELAERIRSIGIASFIDTWTSSGIAAIDHLDETYRSWDRSVRSGNTAEGLANALSGYGQGAQPSVWDSLPKMDIPTLLIAGERDERYVAINRQMAELLPRAVTAVVPDAGHNPIAEQPAITFGVISDFLDLHC